MKLTLRQEKQNITNEHKSLELLLGFGFNLELATFSSTERYLNSLCLAYKSIFCSYRLVRACVPTDA